MLRAAAVARPALRPQHERHRQLAAGHEMRLGRAVDQLVERERDEVDEHDLQHGPQARLCGADRHPRDGRLADRRVDHARRAELLGQAGSGRVGRALGDVLAEHEDACIGSHGGGERTGDRLDVGGLSHRRRPSGRSARPPGTDSRGRTAPLPPRLRRPRTRWRPEHLGEPALCDAVPLQPQNRIPLLPLLCRDRLAVLARIALVVTAQAHDETLQQKWPEARARRGEVGPERLAHREHVIAIDGRALDPVGRHDVTHALDHGVRRARRELREAVVRTRG